MFTIGHSTLPIDIFVNALRQNCVDLLVDVRTVPRSRHNPQFSTETLAKFLQTNAIEYRWMPDLGGLRRPLKDSINMGWRNSSFRGYADYMQTPAFADAVAELAALDGQKTAAILCAEAVPWRCHRSLIGDALLARGHAVEDIFVAPAGATHRKAHILTSFACVDGAQVWYPADPAQQALPLPDEAGAPNELR